MYLLIRGLLIIGLLFAVSGCGFKAAMPITGKVINQDSGEPIEGAIVVVRWIGYRIISFENTRKCIHVESAVTNKEGEYRFSSEFLKVGFQVLSDIHATAVPYVRGYRKLSNASENGVIDPDTRFIKRMTRDDRSVEKRMEYLVSIRRKAGCHFIGRDERNLYPLYLGLLMEMDEIAFTEPHKKSVERMKEIVADIALSDKLPENYDEYRKAIQEYVKENL